VVQICTTLGHSGVFWDQCSAFLHHISAFAHHAQSIGSFTIGYPKFIDSFKEQLKEHHRVLRKAIVFTVIGTDQIEDKGEVDVLLNFSKRMIGEQQILNTNKIKLILNIRIGTRHGTTAYPQYSLIVLH
jgi:hypothetical protein